MGRWCPANLKVKMTTSRNRLRLFDALLGVPVLGDHTEGEGGL